MAKVAKRRGRYVLDFYDNQGKRQRMTMKEGTTLKNAKDRLREIEEQISRGLYMPSKMIPTFEEAAQQWLEYKRPNIRQSTWDMYESHLKHHFSEIGPLKTNRITTADVEQFINQRQRDGMNITTLRKLIVTFNQVMKYAVRHKFTDYNPVRDAERPRGQGGVESDKINVMPADEISSFLDAVSNPKYRALFTLAVLGGLRQGELFGLKWSDMDWEAWSQMPKQPQKKGPPKMDNPYISMWCRRRESNSQGRKARRILSPLRLPISPLRR
jgi:integrase